MYKKIVNFIKNNMNSNTEQFSMRIPSDLKKPLEKKAKSLRLPLPDYVRAIMLNSILPEVLDSELKEVTCEWITKQGKDSIEIHFGEKIKRLKEIVEIASYAIEETEKLQQKFIDIEVEYLNEINSKLH
ncbi:hypothetical protein IJ579_04550 [bacterium]|nr:hypothetical protein [bacterium]